jgi:cytochrome c-type biogenesis protein CcmH
MLFWIICAALTFAAAIAVLYPFLRKNEQAEPSNASDLAIYKDQLREIDDDERRGLISSADAESARTEVSRRILKLAPAQGPLTGRTSSRYVVIAAALAMPVLTWGLYGYTGSPLVPDQPILARLAVPANKASVEILVAQAEKHLAEHPEDGRGWAVIAPIYLKYGRYDKALEAYQKLVTLLGPKAQFEVGIGEALAGLNQGKIGTDASAAFERAAKLEPNDPQPKIFLATGLAQQGKYPEAKSAFEAILANAPADASWRPIVTGSLAELAKVMAAPANGGLKGPTQDDVNNAAGMSGSDRMAMIEGMVAKLDADLATNPDSSEGWKRLIKSYTVIGKPDKAADSLAKAQVAMKDNAVALGELAQMATELGLTKP